MSNLPTIARVIATRYQLFVDGNNDGDGFDPSGDLDGMALGHDATDTSDVAVYYRDGRAILVGTDGSGDDDSRWGVEVAYADHAASE